MFAARKIISGGQTGVDRAALDFALEHGFEIGGYVPKGRAAEDGRIDGKYHGLSETGSGDPARRTELNVKTSDATLIISQGPLAGGSQLTAEFAAEYDKPFLHLDLSFLSISQAAKKTNEWLDSVDGETLNIAGPRASEDADIYALTKRFLDALFGQ